METKVKNKTEALAVGLDHKNENVPTGEVRFIQIEAASDGMMFGLDVVGRVWKWTRDYYEGPELFARGHWRLLDMGTEELRHPQALNRDEPETLAHVAILDPGLPTCQCHDCQAERERSAQAMRATLEARGLGPLVETPAGWTTPPHRFRTR